jgi:hypothetical protein
MPGRKQRHSNDGNLDRRQRLRLSIFSSRCLLTSNSKIAITTRYPTCWRSLGERPNDTRALKVLRTLPSSHHRLHAEPFSPRVSTAKMLHTIVSSLFPRHPRFFKSYQRVRRTYTRPTAPQITLGVDIYSRARQTLDSQTFCDGHISCSCPTTWEAAYLPQTRPTLCLQQTWLGIERQRR